MVAEPWRDGGGGSDADNADGEVGGREDDVNNVDEEQCLPEEAEVEPEVGEGDQEEAEGDGEVEEDVDDVDEGVKAAEEVLENIEAMREGDIELRKICDGNLALMDKNLIPLVSTGESKMFYYVMKDEYDRYLAEFATDEAESTVADEVDVSEAGASDPEGAEDCGGFAGAVH